MHERTPTYKLSYFDYFNARKKTDAQQTSQSRKGKLCPLFFHSRGMLSTERFFSRPSLDKSKKNTGSTKLYKALHEKWDSEGGPLWRSTWQNNARTESKWAKEGYSAPPHPLYNLSGAPFLRCQYFLVFFFSLLTIWCQKCHLVGIFCCQKSQQSILKIKK